MTLANSTIEYKLEVGIGSANLLEGKYKSLGYFDNKEDAYAAYDKAVLLFVDSTVLLNSEIH